MPSSMTGFANLETQHAWGNLVWELKSINHRYLEVQIRLPEPLRVLESALRDHIRRNVYRGKVEATLTMKYAPNTSNTPLTINLDLAKQIAEAARKVQRLLDGESAVDPLAILKWPGVIQDQTTALEVLKADVTHAFEEALQQLVSHRKREGDALQHFIEQRLVNIDKHVQAIRIHLPLLLQKQREKLRHRLEEIATSLDTDRLEQEMVYWSQKVDVDEELDRLGVHVTETKRVLSQQGAIGRRLDFLTQEFNREANTLASKSMTAETTQQAVELKVLIEQIREQAQNIE